MLWLLPRGRGDLEQVGEIDAEEAASKAQHFKEADVPRPLYDFAFSGCAMDPFNASRFVEVLNGRNLVMYGDSLTRLFYVDLACRLYSSAPDKIGEVRGWPACLLACLLSFS